MGKRHEYTKRRSEDSWRRAAGRGANQACSGPAVAYKPKAFTAHEFRTAKIPADLIIPADSRSGNASQAGVPEFMDGYINEADGRIAAQIRGGLAWLDAESRRRFRREFADGTPAQQKEILDLIAWPEKASPAYSHAVAFFNRFRDLTASGFYTSKRGIKDLDYRGNTALNEWTGCSIEAHKKLGIT